ncbi:MAG: hypothetical protein PHF57_06190 [Methanoregula sp.]|nr:hypothetical protein [Methanoregula sp.]
MQQSQKEAAIFEGVCWEMKVPTRTNEYCVTHGTMVIAGFTRK